MKKTALILFLFTIFFLSAQSAFAFFHDKNSSSENELDCYDLLVKATKNNESIFTWGEKPGPAFSYSETKSFIPKRGNDNCELTRLQNPGVSKIEEVFKITHFSDTTSPKSQLTDLKSKEVASSKTKEDTEVSYSVVNAELPPELEGGYLGNSNSYARTVSVMGNCLVEFTYRWLNFVGVRDLTFVSESMETQLKGVKSVVDNTVNSETLQAFCGGKSDVSSPLEQQPKLGVQSPTKQEESGENALDKDSRGFPVFIGEWFKTISGGWFLHDWMIDTTAIIMKGQDIAGLAETEKSLKYIDSLTDNYVYYATGKTKDDLEDIIDREPGISDEIVAQLKQKTQDSPFRLDLLNGQAQIKYPGQNYWSDLKQGDKIPPGSTLFTGMDTTTVLSIRDKGVLQILSFTEVTISEEGLAEPSKTTTDIDLRTGEVELNIEGGVYTGSLQVTTPTVANAVRGTHFWVSYNKDKKLSTVGVYRGEVEVKTTDGKTITVSPNGYKPGVVVVTQKLSISKLILVGVVLVVIIGGVLLLLKRRRNKTFRAKKIR